MRERIFISGPISLGCLNHNLAQAKFATRQLMQAGFAPFCPHLACYLEDGEPKVCACGFTHAEYLEADLPWVDVSDAVLRLPGESVGADMETDRALERGIPVFHNVESLVAHFAALEA